MTYSSTSSFICNATLPGPSLAEMCGASAFVVFMSLLDELIRSNDKISGRCERVKPIETPDEEYDFVVIGGGGAGAVVAGRLSENPDWKILLLEAGDDEPAGGQVPIFDDVISGTSSLNWNFESTNESHACLSTNGSCALRAGKMLGGSTACNGMIYIRGNPTDYNNWAAEGNEGWTWDEVKSFYLLAEDNGEIERVGRFDHATGGPLPLKRTPYIPPFGHSVLAAAREIGYGVSEDLNGQQLTGFTIAQTTSKNGIRRSSASAYLWPARNRDNLHVSLNSLAARLIIEDEKAVGVEYFQKGVLKTVRVSKEVVVSAGTIKSPQLLLLSGIGPKDHLESVGVNVVKDLPGVGENFHDHVAYTANCTINEPDQYDNDWKIAAMYLINQTGPLSVNGLGPIIANLNTKRTTSDFPDYQLHFGSYTACCAPGKIGELRSKEKRTIGIHAVNLHPKSRGRVSLASNDPFQPPLIWFNFLSDPTDLEVLVEAVEAGLAMADTPAMRAYNLTLSTTPIEECSNHTFPSSEYWACAIRHGQAADYHEVGTCKMGPSSDPMAVVDPQLRVHGITGLRVADASIMPQVTSSNTAAPTMMIGERAAHFIKKYWTL